MTCLLYKELFNGRVNVHSMWNLSMVDSICHIKIYDYDWMSTKFNFHFPATPKFEKFE